MNDSFWLSDAQMARIEPYFPLSHGIARVDDRRVLSGIVHVIRTGMRWRDAPPDYGPHKTLYNRFVRWSRLGVFDRIFAALAGRAGEPDLLMIDATHLKGRAPAAIRQSHRPPALRCHNSREERGSRRPFGTAERPH